MLNNCFTSLNYINSFLIRSFSVHDNLWFQTVFVLIILTGGILSYLLRSKKIRLQKHTLEKIVKERTAALEKSYIELQNHQKEIIAQNEEIKTQNEEIYMQNEEIVAQRDEIQRKSNELETLYNKSKILNEFGKKLTALLDTASINKMIYDYLSALMDTSIFGIAEFNEKKNGLVFSNLIELGNPIPEFVVSNEDQFNLASLCYKKQEIIITNDFENEYSKFNPVITQFSKRVPKSLVYIPLTVNKKKLGVMTIQSYVYDAYKEYDITTFESLASFISIAIDNAWAYDMLKHQNEELEKHRTNLAKMVYERTMDLEKAKEKAEESDRLKSAFLANMSHEIRTPMNAIVGFIDLMCDHKIEEQEKELLYPLIINSGHYLSNLINDIIEISKIETNQVELSEEEFVIGDLLNEIYNASLYELQKSNQENKRDVQLLNFSSGIDIDFILKTDLVRIKQVLTNLISNSIKFTKGGSIQFGIKDTAENKLLFYVKDTGIGIEKKYYDIIFERFRKVEDDNEDIYRGTGLGLTISKFIIERLGGKIWVESEPGKGSVFFFEIPLNIVNNTSHNDTFVKKIMKTEEYNWYGFTVLIVEDEKSNYSLLESIFRASNARLLWGKDGHEAVQLFKENYKNINLVLMDIKLPGKNGIDAAREMKEINKDIPVIAHTAHALPQEEIYIRNLYFDDYIAKPVTARRLLAKVSQYISKN